VLSGEAAHCSPFAAWLKAFDQPRGGLNDLGPVTRGVSDGAEIFQELRGEAPHSLYPLLVDTKHTHAYRLGSCGGLGRRRRNPPAILGLDEVADHGLTVVRRRRRALARHHSPVTGRVLRSSS
jgi:hypothetical protein